MLDQKLRHKIFNKIRMRFVRAKKDLNEPNIREEFQNELSKAYDEQERRTELGLNPNTYKVKPKPEPIEMPNPIELLPEKPQKPLEDIRKEIGSVHTKRGDNTGFDDLEGLLKQTFGNPSLKHIAQNKELEKAVNESLERQTTQNICKKCLSSVCKCHKEGSEQ